MNDYASLGILHTAGPCVGAGCWMIDSQSKSCIGSSTLSPQRLQHGVQSKRPTAVAHLGLTEPTSAVAEEAKPRDADVQCIAAVVLLAQQGQL
jgi:hypothetical protein